MVLAPPLSNLFLRLWCVPFASAVMTVLSSSVRILHVAPSLVLLFAVVVVVVTDCNNHLFF